MADAPFRNIMVATDLDESSALTMQYAGVIAERFHSRTTVLYADHLGFPVDPLGDVPLAPFSTNSDLGGAERAVRDYATQWLPATVPVDLALVPGHPAAVILSAVREHAPDLLILGTQQRRMWSAPVAENVIRRSTRPVLVVPPRRVVAAERPTPGITRIVCPVNFSEVAREALVLAATLTEAFLAELTVLHVAESESSAPEELLRRHLRSWISPTVADRCIYREVVEHGSAAERIVAAVEDLGADLLVVGAQQTQFRGESVIGTTTERLVRLGRFPILTVVRQSAEREVVLEESEPQLARV